MENQTAVEWQFEQLFNSFEKFNNGEYSFNEYLKRNLEIREQSKEMEMQQIIDAVVWFDDTERTPSQIDIGAQLYYNETFKTK